MLVSDTYRFIFVHIPRTAGFSVMAALKPFADAAALDFSQVRWEEAYPHYMAMEISQIVGKERFENFFKFSLVRNPWDRMVSRYFLLRQFNGRSNEPINSRGYYPPGPRSFREWLLGQDRHAVHPLDLRQQIDWLVGDSSDLIVDYVGRFENLDHTIEFISRKVDVKLTLPHLNRSDHRQYRDYYDDEARDYVARVFSTDIETWGYEY